MLISNVMKRFALRVFMFFIIVCVAVALLFVVFPYDEDGFMREYPEKISKIDNDSREPAIIIIGGSNVAFGFNTEMIADSMSMPAYNCGLNAGLGLKFIIDDCIRYLRKGDVLVISPEYDHFFNNNAEGGGSLAELFYMNPGYGYEVFDNDQKYEVIRNLPTFIESNIFTFFTDRFVKRNSNDYKIYRKSAFNSYGDVVAHWIPDAKGIADDRVAKHILNADDAINTEYMAYLKGEIDKLEYKGIRVLIIPPVIAKSQFEYGRNTLHRLTECMHAYGLNFICSPELMSYDNSLFYDSVYHLREKGAKLRSMQLIGLLRDNGIY